MERWISAPHEKFSGHYIFARLHARQMKVSKTLQYNSSTQAAGEKLCQDLGVLTGVFDSWSAKYTYSGNLCCVCVSVCVCDCMLEVKLQNQFLAE